MKTTIAVFIVLLGLQGGFWYRTHHIKPDMSIVPDVPGRETVKALSFGDDEAFFRLLGLQIQNAGDTYGRFTALYKYDYRKLYHWFRLLDALDDESNYIPSMATYYFGQTQKKSDIKYIVDYLVEHAADRPQKKWWWLVQGIYLANHKLNDPDLAIRIAEPLKQATDAPAWVQQMPAFVHEQRGEYGAALEIIQNLLEHEDELSQGELNFIRYFVDERLGKMKEVEAQLEKRQEALDKNKDAGASDNEADSVKKKAPAAPDDAAPDANAEPDATPNN